MLPVIFMHFQLHVGKTWRRKSYNINSNLGLLPCGRLEIILSWNLLCSRRPRKYLLLKRAQILLEGNEFLSSGWESLANREREKKKINLHLFYNGLVIQMSHSMSLVKYFPKVRIKISLVLSKEFRIASQMSRSLHILKFFSCDISVLIKRVQRQ